MNYYKQFAEMIGLELDQEFVLTDIDGKIKDWYTYKITENGIFYKSKISGDWLRDKPLVVEELLKGCIKAVPKQWKPKKGDNYSYYINSTYFEGINSCMWTDECLDLLHWKVGNCFKTEEEAKTKGKEIMEQIQKEYEKA